MERFKKLYRMVYRSILSIGMMLFVVGWGIYITFPDYHHIAHILFTIHISLLIVFIYMRYKIHYYNKEKKWETK